MQVRIRKRTEDDPTVILWLRNLEREKPRYYRDNMKLLLHVISEYGKETVIAALRTCLEKKHIQQPFRAGNIRLNPQE